MKILDKIYIFYCTRTFEDNAAFLPEEEMALDFKTVPLACSSMVKDLFLLKAFEAGADAVTVWVCPEGACRHVTGNLRARKRVERVKALLDDIGLDGRRLTLFNFIQKDHAGAAARLKEIASTLSIIGKNPAGDSKVEPFEESRPKRSSA